MSSEPRFLLYCHNVLGLGHIVRSLRIARALIGQGQCQIRLVTGCRFLDRLQVPDEVEVVRLPALRAREGGGLTAVSGASAGKVLQERSRRIEDEVHRFQPHVVLIDHNPLGLLGELARTLDSESSTRFVWGVRDIWGTPAYLAKGRRFGEGPAAAASRMDRYHCALAYTDSAWLDTFALYQELVLPQTLLSVGFVTDEGFEPESRATTSHDQPQSKPRNEPLAVALFGGGTNARELAELLMQALRTKLERNELRLRLVVGPFSPGVEAIRDVVGPDVEIWAEGSAEASCADADLVICRTGYNTAYSIVRSDKPLIFVPIVAENGEQTMRAERLSELDGVDMIHEDASGAAEDLERAVVKGLERGPVERSLPFATDGAEQTARTLFDIAYGGTE